MKRAISLALTAVMLLALCACGSSAAAETTPEPTAESTAEPTPIPTPEPTAEPAPTWTINHYVDDFGDETGGIYLSATFDGVFSNTATTNSPLKVVVYYVPGGVMSADEFSFRLLEYNDTRATYTNNSDTTIKVKVDDDIYATSLYGIAPNGDVSLFNNFEERLMCFNAIFDTLTAAEKDVRCIIEIDHSEYSFTMEGSGFADGVEQLMAVNDFYPGTEIKKFDVVVESASLPYWDSIPNLPYSAQAYTYGGTGIMWNTEEDCRAALQIYLDYLEGELGLTGTESEDGYHYQTEDGKTISLYIQEPGPDDVLLSYKVYTLDISIE